MKITAELLRQHSSCDSAVQFIEKRFPDGVEAVDLMRTRHIPKLFFHWGREQFRPSPEELATYCEVCKIVNSKDYWYSESVTNSQRVVYSKRVENSIGVFDSEDVREGFDIVRSKKIEQGSQIFDSVFVEASKQVFNSKNVASSENVWSSTMVNDSKGIFSSQDVFGSMDILDSSHVEDSYFCANCHNVKHCLFCSDISDKDYCIFNHAIGEKQFELFKKQYLKYVETGGLVFLEEWPKELVSTVELNENVKPKFNFFPESFWEWVRTLPNFDSILVYDITILPEILVD